MRDRANCVFGCVFEAARAVARAGGVVCQVAGEDAVVGGEGEVLRFSGGVVRVFVIELEEIGGG